MDFILRNRFFLRNYPPEVVLVINGQPITRDDILRNKRERQARKLACKLRNTEPVVKQAFIWTFYNSGFIYGGWWLYVKTLKNDWQIDSNSELTLKIMCLYPCGFLPMIENFREWKASFAEMYAYSTRKRLDLQGMALARVVVSSAGFLLDVLPFERGLSQ